MTGLRERPMEWWAARAEAEVDGVATAGRAAAAETTLRRQAVLAHVVAPFVEGLETPAHVVDEIRASLALKLLQPELRERREVLGDHVFVLTMQEEIAARVVALADLLAERATPAP
ncbi:hypothetical protein NS228_04970 [Methylobacterium indicum]|uniref:hypothetical protein n=1 Tax=Methylobacterium indicum TaxID=1775910 RepID=UPI000734150A|nr:hypothetical protein [Methylobacterium indicum]KTS39514.1 hypothetical protein NS229_00095 [Methylobacterium indicum]KTS41738.1 hypothetical protein NS228_04970 [Methylobacterium indicum]KTS53524.1 hypothetical protein NS230_05485 [Methylobacterium indicum]